MVMEYAVIETGGKQYTVHAGDIVDVEKLEVSLDEAIELDKGLLIAKDGDYKVGSPLVEGAKVLAQVVGHERAPKIKVFKYKNKTRYRRMQGHKQPRTQLKITEILAEAKAPARRRRTTKAEADGS